MVTETDVHVLKEKSADENPIVRTEAFNTISKEHREFDESLLSIMEVGCSDHDVDTKKAAMKALSEIFKAKFHNTKVLKGWVRFIPRLITDEDKSVRKECEKVFKELVLDRISQAQSRHHEVLFNYGIVLMLMELDGGELSKWVKKIIGNLGKNCKVEPDVARSLCFIIERSERTWLELKKPIDKWLAPAGAWFLLSEVSRFLIDVVNYNFLLHYWELLTNKSNDKAKEKDKHNSKHRASNRASLLEMIATRCVIPAHPVDKVDMGKQFLQRITSFQIPCTEVDVLLRAFNELYQQLASNREDCGEQMTTAVNKMLSQAKNILNSHKKKSDACLYKATYMIGSVACVYTEHDYLPIAQYLLELVISLQDEKEAPLYIQIWLTICKLWYVDDQVGITYASKLLEVLKDTNAHEVVRSSILMNVTHHQLHESEIYEWYSAGITKCLYDRSEVVRRQAFKLLCRLLTEGGKNLKPQLFLQFLRSIVDDSENIKELANGLFWNQLKAEEPELVYDMFVDAIFDLNDCDSKTIKCKPKHTSVRGIKMMSSDQRNTIYVSMLKQMTPCQINSTYENICFQILGSETVVNSLHDSSRFVLEDALAILSYKDIQIPSPSGVVFNADMIQIYIKLITRIETTYTSLMRGLLHLYKKHGTDFEMINGDDAAKLKSEILKYEVTQKKEENINGKKI